MSRTGGNTPLGPRQNVAPQSKWSVPARRKKEAFRSQISSDSLSRLFQFIHGIELVVERFQTYAEFIGRTRFAAAVTFKRLIDRLHFQISQRHWTRSTRGRACELTSVELRRQMLGRD